MFKLWMLLLTLSAEVAYGVTVRERVAAMFYEHAGFVPFRKLKKYEIKDIHISGTKLESVRLEVVGQVKEVGSFRSFAILNDGSGQLLVNLAKVSGSDLVQREAKIRVFGVIRYGSRGRPFLEAQGVSEHL